MFSYVTAVPLGVVLGISHGCFHVQFDIGWLKLNCFLFSRLKLFREFFTCFILFGAAERNTKMVVICALLTVPVPLSGSVG